MSRSGDDIYSSDDAFDFLLTVTNRLERELAYWFSPEKVTHAGWWVAQVFSVVEVMLLLERGDKGSTVYIDDDRAAERWREVFLSVWDGEWQDEEEGYHYYIYSEPKYRKENRLLIVKIFDHWVAWAKFWTILGTSGVKRPSEPALLDFPPPYFSVRRWTNKDGDEDPIFERFTDDLIGYLVREIIYCLSSEKRAEIILFTQDDLWVAVDLLGFLCEMYEHPPEVNKGVVRAWRETAVEIWKQFLEGDSQTWDETDPLYRNVMAAFDRLEAMAQKYPSIEW